MKKVSGLQLSHETLEHYRFRAVKLWKEGKKINDVAHFFGLHRVTVSYWISTYRKKGEKALQSKKAPGPELKLQMNEVKKVLQALAKPATVFGFETPLWTCKRACYVIKKVTRKKLDNSNVWRLLKRFGLSNQKPERRAMEQNPKETKHWLEVEWPKIQAHARRWQAMLYFQDESGISLTPNLGKTWAPKGKTPVVKVTGKRGGFCVSSAVSPAGRLLFRLEKKTVNAEKFVDFLAKILNHHKNRKVIVVADRAPVHRAQKVSDFVKQNQKRFALYYLPSYSPELNPDEEVWAHLKENKLKTHQAQTVGELRNITLAGMKSIQMQAPLIQSFFHNIM